MLTRHSQNHNIILVRSYNKTMNGLVINKNCTFIRKEKKLHFHLDRKKIIVLRGKNPDPPGYEMGWPLLYGQVVDGLFI